MRKNLTPFIALFLALTLFSCASDDSLEEIQSVETADLTATISRSSSPCAKNLLSMVSNSQLNLDCKSDLGGKTINLPKGVKLNFDGGTLKNGTLHFEGGTIDGRLLSKGLKITGDVSLANSTYTFDPSQWGITEGKTSDAKAFINRVNLNEAIELTKSLGGNTLEIGELDAYFEITKVTGIIDRNFYEWEEAIRVPSNFHLKLSDNTNLRVQPNDNRVYSLVAFDGTNNARLSGGNLYGDREDHIFEGQKRFASHEWGHLILFYGAKNSIAENVYMHGANGDNLKIQSESHLFKSDYSPSENVTVKNCTIEAARRNGLTITGAHDVVIDNNTFIKNGIDVRNSEGTNPGFALDIEAFSKEIAGQMVAYEDVNGVVIKNNNERGSKRGGFIVSRGDNVTIENNYLENSLTYRYTEGTSIRNNTLVAENIDGGAAITGGANNWPTKNNEISGNKISGYRQGINIYGKKNKVYDNEINECYEAIFIRNLRDSKIYNNKIRSSVNKSRGIFGFAGTMDNVEFNNNDVITDRSAFEFQKMNQGWSQRNFEIKVKNNSFTSKSRYAKLYDAHGVIFENNDVYSAIWIEKSEDIKYIGNNLDGRNGYRPTVYFRGGNKDIELGNNQLTARKGQQCTLEDKNQRPGEVKEYGNRWSYK